MPLDQMNWRDVYGIVVAANQAQASVDSGSDYGRSLYNTVFGPNCDAYVTIPTIDVSAPGQMQVSVIARYDPDAETGYRVSAIYQGGGGVDEIRIADMFGSPALASYNVTLADGDAIGIRCDGNDINAYHYTLGAWALLGTVVDATYPGAGLCGLDCQQDPTAIAVENFGAGNETGAAFPEPGVVDSFNRPDTIGPPPSTSWVDQFVMGVVGNEGAARQTPNNYDIPSMWRTLFDANQEAYATIATRPPDSTSAYCYARFQDINNTLYVHIFRNDVGGDFINIQQFVGGVQNDVVGDVAINYQDGDSFGIRCSGSTIEAWYKPVGGVWGALGSGVTTLPVADGYIGLFVQDTTIRLGNFGGGGTAPVAPTNLVATGISTSQIDLAWVDNSTNETGFKVERKDSGSSVFVQIDTVGANITTYSDSGLAPNAIYTYRVRAYNLSSSDSAYTNEATAATSTTIGYSIITPDGVVYGLSSNGLGVNPGIPDGFGFPPITHRTSKLYRSAGALLNGIDVEPRIVTITISAIASSQDALHAVRAALWAALRWNRTLTDPPPPSKLRYTANGHTVDLHVHYLSDVQGNAGNANNLQLIGVRLIAYDPMWYAVTPVTDALDFSDSFDTYGFVGRNGLAWSPLGLTWTNGTILAVAVSNDGNTLYVGGGFTDINHVGINRIVSYDRITGVWSAMGTGFNNGCRAIAVAPNGDVYAAGSFTTADGNPAAHIAMWDGSNWNALDVGTDADVYALAIDRNGLVYVGGAFSNAGGAPASGVAVWDPVATTWSALGAGTSINVYALAVGLDGTLYAGGSFDPLLHIAQWDGANWSTVGAGFDGQVQGLAVGKNGLLYATGLFTALDSGEPVAYVAMWNGADWSALDSGLDDWGYTVAVTDDGSVYVGGAFTTAGGLVLADSVAVWNGTTWSQLDIDLPGVADIYAMATYGNDLYMVHENTGGVTTYCSALTTLTTVGDAETFPIITVTGPGMLQFIINHTSDEQLVFNLYINPGEVITIDLSPGVKSVTSSWPWRPGNAVGLVLPASDLGVWSLKPAPAALGGDNVVAVYMTDTTGDSDCTIEYFYRWLSADEACK